MGDLRRALAVCLLPRHLRRTAAIALIVGTWLTLVNQGDTLLAAVSASGASSDLGMAIKVALNYLTPFVVSNFGLLSRS